MTSLSYYFEICNSPYSLCSTHRANSLRIQRLFFDHYIITLQLFSAASPISSFLLLFSLLLLPLFSFIFLCSHEDTKVCNNPRFVSQPSKTGKIKATKQKATEETNRNRVLKQRRLGDCQNSGSSLYQRTISL